jgi:hypothetical protein
MRTKNSYKMSMTSMIMIALLAGVLVGCDGVTSCQFLCDLVDIAGLCTLSVAAACSIYCI